MKEIKQNDVIIILPGPSRHYLVKDFKKEYLDIPVRELQFILTSYFKRQDIFGIENISSCRTVEYRRYKGVVLRVYDRYLAVKWENKKISFIAANCVELFSSSKGVIEESSSDSDKLKAILIKEPFSNVYLTSKKVKKDIEPEESIIAEIVFEDEKIKLKKRSKVKSGKKSIFSKFIR